MARLKSLSVTGSASGNAQVDAVAPEEFVRKRQLDVILAPIASGTHAPVTVSDTPSLALRLASGTQSLSGFVRRKTTLGNLQGAILEDPSGGGVYVRLGSGANDAARGADVAALSAALAGKSDVGHTHAMEDIDGLEDALAAKADSSHSHSNATESAPGFMSATDKAKLDGLGGSTVVKFSKTICNGIDQAFIVEHSLGTEDVCVQVRHASGTKDFVDCDVNVIDANNVGIGFAYVPSSGSHRVTVV